MDSTNVHQNRTHWINLRLHFPLICTQTHTDTKKGQHITTIMCTHVQWIVQIVTRDRGAIPPQNQELLVLQRGFATNLKLSIYWRHCCLWLDARTKCNYENGVKHGTNNFIVAQKYRQKKIKHAETCIWNWRSAFTQKYLVPTWRQWMEL